MAEHTTARDEVQRIAVSPPLSAAPTSDWTVPQPTTSTGERIQVTAHLDEYGRILERWQFSDEDVRWYKLQAFKDQFISYKRAQRVPVVAKKAERANG